MSNITNDETKKAIKFAKAAFRLYQLGSANFCETLIKVFGRYGEKTYLYWEKRNEIEDLILNSIKRANKEEIEECLNLLLSILGEIESNQIVNIIVQLLDKIDPIKVKRSLSKLIKDEIITTIQLSKQVRNIINQLETRKLSKLLMSLGDFIEQETIDAIVDRVSSSEDPVARQWLNVYRAEKITQNDVWMEIEQLIEKLAYSLSYEKNPLKILEQLLLLYLLYSKLELEEKKKLEEKIKPYVNDLFLKILTVDPKLFDKPLGEAIKWLISMINNMEDYLEEIFNLLLELVKRDIIDNIENVTELVTRANLERIRKIEPTIFSISKSGNWRLRELSLLLAQSIYNNTKEEKWLKLIKNFCNDKRSIIRKTCSNFLLQVMERDKNKINRSYYSSIINSKDTKSIAKLLNLISNFKPDQKDLQYVIDRAIKIPRSTIYNAILNVLNQHWRKIDPDKLTEYLHKMLIFSRNKKTLRLALTRLVKEIASSSNTLKEKLKGLIEEFSSE